MPSDVSAAAEDSMSVSLELCEREEDERDFPIQIFLLGRSTV